MDLHYVGELKRGSVLRAVFDDLTDARLEWTDMGDVHDNIVLGKEVYPFSNREEPPRGTQGPVPGRR